MDEAAIQEIRARALDIIDGALDQIAERGGLVTASSEAQIQRAVDLLRDSQADVRLLKIAEFLSCAMFEMSGFLRQGRVNAYESKALRVRRAVATTGLDAAVVR